MIFLKPLGLASRKASIIRGFTGYFMFGIESPLLLCKNPCFQNIRIIVKLNTPLSSPTFFVVGVQSTVFFASAEVEKQNEEKTFKGLKNKLKQKESKRKITLCCLPKCARESVTCKSNIQTNNTQHAQYYVLNPTPNCPECNVTCAYVYC